MPSKSLIRQQMTALKRFIAMGVATGVLVGVGVTGFRVQRARSQADSRAIPVELTPEMDQFNHDYLELLSEMKNKKVHFKEQKRGDITYKHPYDIEFNIDPNTTEVQLRKLVPPEILQRMVKLAENYEQFAPELEKISKRRESAVREATSSELKRGAKFTGKSLAWGGAAGLGAAGAAGAAALWKRRRKEIRRRL